jgi:hypothetical protein
VASRDLHDKLPLSCDDFLWLQMKEVCVSNGFNSDPTPAELPFNSTEPAAESAAVSRDLHGGLAAILEQILMASEDGSTLPSNDSLAELIAVASRYPTTDFCVDPVLLELIQAVTRRMKGVSENRLPAMERAVAASLSDDQVSLGRLQTLWEHLKRAVSNG